MPSTLVAESKQVLLNFLLKNEKKMEDVGIDPTTYRMQTYRYWLQRKTLYLPFELDPQKHSEYRYGNFEAYSHTNINPIFGWRWC